MLAPLLIILSPVAEQDAGCALSHVPLPHMGAHPLSLAGWLPQVRTWGFITQVSVLMKICSAAKKLTHSLTALVLSRAVVAVWRIPSPFGLPSPCCTFTSPAAACLRDLSPGTCPDPFLGADVVLQNSEGHSDRKRLVAFCVCESHSPAEQRGGDRLWLGQSLCR